MHLSVLKEIPIVYMIQCQQIQQFFLAMWERDSAQLSGFQEFKRGQIQPPLHLQPMALFQRYIYKLVLGIIISVTLDTSMKFCISMRSTPMRKGKR